jgi:imidazolonepropionase-like amidohydrolase
VLPVLAAAAIAVRGVTVIDGTGAAPRPDSTVVIREGRIVAAGRSGQTPVPPDAQVLEGRGRFLTPGFVDMHAHVTYLEWKRDARGRSKGIYNRAVSEKTLKLLLAFGVTTVRNPAAPSIEGVRLREDVARGLVVGPRILTAGHPLNRTSYFDGLTRPVSTAEDVRREVAHQARAGVDYVKLYTALTPDLSAAAIAEAHARGLKVIGHLQATNWIEAAELGIDGLCHGTDWSESELPEERRKAYRRDIAARGPMKARLTWLESVDPKSPEIAATVEALVRRGLALDPTLIAYATTFRGDDREYLASPDLALAPVPMRASFPRVSLVRDWTAGDFRRGHAVWKKMLALVKLYADRGVLLTIGSDEPNAWIVPGPSLHREMALLVQAGIPRAEVLKMATSNAAKALGIQAEAGTIEAGKRADLVLLTADPTADISNSDNIEWVMKAGVRYEPKKLLAEAR